MGRQVEPPSQGEGRPPARWTVSKLAPSIDRQAVAISGASFFASIRPRQSKD